MAEPRHQFTGALAAARIAGLGGGGADLAMASINAGEAVAAVVHAVKFDDPANAVAGFARLTPRYLVRSFPGDVTFGPWLDALRGELPTAQAEVYTYSHCRRAQRCISVYGAAGQATPRSPWSTPGGDWLERCADRRGGRGYRLPGGPLGYPRLSVQSQAGQPPIAPAP